MNTHTQILWNDFTALGASLRCAPGVDFNQLPTSFFRFVRKQIKKQSPCRIIDVFVENFVIAVDHLFWFQVFEKDKTKSINYFSTDFVQKISALIAYFRIQTGKLLSGFARTLFRVLPVKLFEVGFIVLEMLGIVDNLAVGHSGKGLNTDINSDFLSTRSEDFRRNIITGERGIESFILLLDRNCFDLAFKRSVEFYSNAADILNIKFPRLEPDAITVGRKGNRIKTVPAFKSRKSRLVTRAQTTKECLKRLIQAPEDLLRCGIIELCNTFIKAADFFKRVGLIVIVDRFMPLAPADNALFQGAIVKKPSGVKKTIQFKFLVFIGEKPVFERLPHLFALLILNIFPNRRFVDMPYAAGIITSAPKCWQLATQRWEFLTQHPTGIAFQPIYYFGDTPGWIMFKKQMNVIRHDFKSINNKFKLRRFFAKQLIKPLCHRIGKHFAPIFRTPNYV